MHAAAWLLLVTLTTGCGARRWHHLYIFPQCADGLPVEVLIDPACPPDGVCGYSCLPGRWEDLGPPRVANLDQHVADFSQQVIGARRGRQAQT